MTRSASQTNVMGVILAGSTLVAAVFVAVQAWYARVQYVQDAESRLLERKLDLCFQNFDEAAALDTALRTVEPVNGEVWPPRIMLEDAEKLTQLQDTVVPRLNVLEAGLTKASILGELDKHRAYLAQQLSGLSKRLLDIVPAQIGQDKMNKEISVVTDTLSEFLGAQYPVFAGCRLVAEGKA